MTLDGCPWYREQGFTCPAPDADHPSAIITGNHLLSVTQHCSTGNRVAFVRVHDQIVFPKGMPEQVSFPFFPPETRYELSAANARKPMEPAFVVMDVMSRADERCQIAILPSQSPEARSVPSREKASIRHWLSWFPMERRGFSGASNT